MATRSLSDIYRQADDVCQATCPIGKPYMCTLPTNHAGDHEAETVDDDGIHLRVIETWPQADTGT